MFLWNKPRVFFTKFTIRGVDISFTFKPYKVQEDFMHKVIESLQGRKNDVLESATGNKNVSWK